MFSGFYLVLVLLLVGLIVRGRVVRVPRQAGLGPMAAHLGRHAHRRQRAGPAAGRRRAGQPARAACRSTTTRSSPATWSTCSARTRCSSGSACCCCAPCTGSAFLTLKTDGEVEQRAQHLARAAGPRRRPGRPRAGASGPSHRRPRRASRTLFQIDLGRSRASRPPWLLRERAAGWAFAATTVTIAATIVSIFSDLYPRVMVSSTSSAYDLTVAELGVGVLRPQGHDRRRRSSCCPPCWCTRAGPTTCSAPGSAPRPSP